MCGFKTQEKSGCKETAEQTIWGYFGENFARAARLG